MFKRLRCAPQVGASTSALNFFGGILRGPGEGQGGAPSTVPLQNSKVTSRKAYLRNADSWIAPSKSLGEKDFFKEGTLGASPLARP